MKSIVEFMTSDHKACDHRFALAEQAAHSGHWPEAEIAFDAFAENMKYHFRNEEDVLFPALLDAGGPSGPVHMMTMEHAQMNSLLDNMATAIVQKNAHSYSGLSETLLIVMQQHNLKEEQILYPIAESMLACEWPLLHNRFQTS